MGLRLPGQRSATVSDERPQANATGAGATVLPSPPDDIQRDVYWQRRAPVLIVGGLGALLVTLIATTRLTLVEHSFAPYFVVVIALAVVGLAAIWGHASKVSTSRAAHRALVDWWAPAYWPTVDVWLPICNEPREVLLNTWKHIAALQWPGMLKVTVLDDGGDPEVAALAEGFGFAYLCRPNRGWMKKSGNLQFAYQQTSGAFVSIFDADFCPRPDFLLELMPYFDDPALGIVQSPQYFDVTMNQGWLQRGAGAVQELFYRGIQPGRDAHGAAVCVGTNAIYRRAALDSNGGTTIIGHSEDVHTGFDLARNGWTLRYVPVILATGVCPADVSSFFRQQYRWCVGSMSLVTSRKFWNASLSLRARACYLGGFGYYAATAIAVLIGPAVPLALLLWFPELIHLRNYVLLTPIFLWRFVMFPRWHRCRYGLEAWTVSLIYGWAHLFALIDVARGRPMGWRPTGSAGGRELRDRILIGALVLWSGVLSVTWLVIAGVRDLDMDGAHLNFIPMMALGAFSVAVVARAFTPVARRKVA